MGNRLIIMVDIDDKGDFFRQGAPFSYRDMVPSGCGGEINAASNFEPYDVAVRVNTQHRELLKPAVRQISYHYGVFWNLVWFHLYCC